MESKSGIVAFLPAGGRLLESPSDEVQVRSVPEPSTKVSPASMFALLLREDSC